MSLPRKRAFMQADVFSQIPTQGNGLAVVLEADGLSTEMMQAFAQWTNLAETTFICPPTDPEADYDLRIFTPVREMKFAGHPTLGSAACWGAAGHKPKRPGVIVQHCGVGLVKIELRGHVPAFVAPPTRQEAMNPALQARLAAGIGVPETAITGSAILDNGPIWHVLELTKNDFLADLDPTSFDLPPQIGLGLIAPRRADDAEYEVRMFSTYRTLKEDPITGSLNAALAHWFQAQGRADTPYTVAQGLRIGRQGRVFVIPSDDGIVRIGGHTNVLITGQVTL